MKAVIISATFGIMLAVSVACSGDPLANYCADIKDHYERYGEISLEAGLGEDRSPPEVFGAYVDFFTADGTPAFLAEYRRICGYGFLD